MSPSTRSNIVTVLPLCDRAACSVVRSTLIDIDFIVILSLVQHPAIISSKRYWFPWQMISITMALFQEGCRRRFARLRSQQGFITKHNRQNTAVILQEPSNLPCSGKPGLPAIAGWRLISLGQVPGYGMREEAS